MLKEGLVFSQEKIVQENETAAVLGSGGVDVFSTPMLIAFMENTAYKLVQEHLEEGESTVGTVVNIEHLKANLVGDKLKCQATLKKIEGKKLEFEVSVSFGEETVGKGNHTRYIVNLEKFLGKLKR
ncbi:thioesterase family protein [Cetobacterium sp. 8H]|uniref:thioesterase family protein n=1 Tax=Cetobacterium sp. 8H TaxID=2759681 RepID=UPI00163C2899|nr:thioesterase family protein [Cetobacterium sp. 8H]MBC2851377.1 thioesterase family protein [Cetobacterium sp. 8H]